MFWLQWLKKKILSHLCNARNSRPPFFFLLTACMLLLAGLQCSWVGLLCLKQQLVHRLTLQDEGFPVAVSEAWKAEMLLVKILWYPSHLTFRRTFHEVYGWWSTSCLTWKLSKVLYNPGLTELSTNWRWHQCRTRRVLYVTLDRIRPHWTFFVVTCAKKWTINLKLNYESIYIYAATFVLWGNTADHRPTMRWWKALMFQLN